MFGLTPFELRYDVAGRVAVRVAGGGVMERHVEGEPSAPWMIEARCGLARGWLLATDEPADPARVATWLQAEVAHRTAALRERQALTLAALDADLLERLTHRLRTDVMTLATVAEGALEGLFDDEATDVAAELRRTSQEAQRRMTAAREVMTTLAAPTRSPEPVAATLRAELEGAGRESVPVTATTDEEAWTAIGGAGWAACARILAADDRVAAFAIAPDDGGWRVTAAPREDPARASSPAVAGPDATSPGPGASSPGPTASSPGPTASPPAANPWADRSLGDLVRAVHLVVAAGGHAEARDGGLTLVLPGAVG